MNGNKLILVYLHFATVRDMVIILAAILDFSNSSRVTELHPLDN